MKKIIAFALALIVATSLFAATAYGYDHTDDALYVNTSTDEANGYTKAASGTTDTDLALQLKRTPIYTFGITNGALSGAVDYKTAIANTDTITLERDTDNVLGIKTNNAYYLSYVFYEYDKVNLTLSLSGDLAKTGVATPADNQKIPYYLTVAEAAEYNESNTATGNKISGKENISSSAAAEKDRSYTLSYEKTEALGNLRYASLQLTVKPQNDNPLLGKAEGSYKSTITVNVVSKG